MFLATNAAVTNRLISVLLHSQQSDDASAIAAASNAEGEDRKTTTKSSCDVIKEEEGSGLEYGLYLAHAVHAVQLIDAIKYILIYYVQTIFLLLLFTT